MQIRGWHIDGFGVLHDYRVEDIPAGLTVFSGPNEAGKSTLLAFIRGMLFGFVPGPGGVDTYPPLRGGHHGGQITLADGEGATYVVARTGTRRGARITRDGEPMPDDTLASLLGGTDRHLFDAVFAFNLADLQALEHLGHAEIQEHLTLTGIAGAARSPAQAIRSLAARRAALGTDGRLAGRADRGQDPLADVTARLARAREALVAYDDVRVAEREAGERIASLDAALRAARAERDEASLALRLWPAWRSRQEAEAALDEVPDVDPVADQAEQIDGLVTDIADYGAAIERLGSAAARRDEAAAAIEARLRDLGPDWDRSRLRDTGDTTAIRQVAAGFADRVERAELAAEAAAREVLAARGRVTREVRERAELESAIAAGTAGIDEEALLGRQAAIRRMRARRADLTSGILQVQVARTTLDGLEELRFQAATSPGTGGTLWLGRLLAVAGLVLLALAIWAGVGDDLAPAAAYAAGGIVALVLGAALISQVRRGERDRKERQGRIGARYAAALATLEEQTVRLANVRTGMAVDAAAAGCSPEPTSTELEEADRKAADALQSLREAESRRHDLDAMAERVREAEAAADSRVVEQSDRVRERDAIVGEWKAWLFTTPLPSTLPPRGILAFLDLVDSGRQRLETETAAIEDASTLQATVERVEGTLADVSGNLRAGTGGSTHVPNGGAVHSDGPTAFERGEPTVEAIRSLAARLEVERERQGQREALRAAIRTADAQMAAIATDADPGPIRDRLAEGDPDRWRGQIDVATSVERETTEALATARREATEASVRRRALEVSTEVADLELERNALLAERAIARREATVLAMAEGLLREMVARVERERQPEVLRLASGLFERITDGQYRRVFREVGGAGGLAIKANDGSVRPPGALSRGTLEQLYLALRLGLAVAFVPRVGKLPLVLDDVLVNFDPERALGVARALQDVARDRQVLLFTSQPATVDVMRSVEGGVAHFAMARHGTGGDWVDR
ncbi:MAG: DNA double-strand break repair Rad50 ATPase [uncultured Thermomicrobiales bacterium]|uniref:DNA double-strand break repair Rad50 ATPase n=1 Tax=uncultured Thermomicrobiales bacterium TaxID=1645740 RepID=A0A6J4UCJ1_9BACT|nr:MAG: DNA double-strand break repair Rad50 ATPase [uncultured Thermomicrobiales bacterium]